MLYIVSTPIGNIADITFRAIDTLKVSDYILCEDTRISRRLLNHYEIKTPLKSFHQFSEAAKEDSIIQDLQNGKEISLISDAGTPGISDPGERLVKRCKSASIQIVPIPGPSAVIAALSVSGLSTSTFQFIGFLPRKSGELKHILIDALHYRGTTVCYESPNRLLDVLTTLASLAPKRKIAVGREITKKFEEFLFGTVKEILEKGDKILFKGEITLLIEGDEKKELNQWKELPVETHVSYLEKVFALSRKEAIKLAADLRGAPKREIYQKLLP